MIDLLSRYRLTCAYVLYVGYVAGVFELYEAIKP